MRAQAVLEKVEVGPQLGGVGIGARLRPVIDPPGALAGLQGGGQLAVDESQLLAVGLPAIALGGSVRGLREEGGIPLEAGPGLEAHALALRRAQVAMPVLEGPQEAPERPRLGLPQ